jgi:hypothetical protein
MLSATYKTTTKLSQEKMFWERESEQVRGAVKLVTHTQEVSYSTLGLVADNHR